jgi:hypothetical protein
MKYTAIEGNKRIANHNDLIVDHVRTSDIPHMEVVINFFEEIGFKWNGEDKYLHPSFKNIEIQVIIEDDDDSFIVYHKGEELIPRIHLTNLDNLPFVNDDGEYFEFEYFYNFILGVLRNIWESEK